MIETNNIKVNLNKKEKILLSENFELEFDDLIVDAILDTIT